MNKTLLKYAASCMLLFLTAARAAAIDTPEQDLERGRTLLNGGKHEEGLRILQKAARTLRASMRDKPEDANSFFLLGKAYFYMNEDKEAAAAFDKVIELAPRNPEPRFYKGLILYYEKDLEGAIREFSTACDLDPEDPRYWMELGRALSLQGRNQNALAAYRKTIALDPDNAQALYNAGVVLMALKRQDLALNMFLRAHKARPDSADTAYNAGQIYQNMGLDSRALSYFIKARELDPDDWKTRAKIIQEYQALGKEKERDRARANLLALRKGGTIDMLNKAEVYCRDQFAVGDKKVMALEYFKPEGERARKYVFMVLDKRDDRKQCEISLGSYEEINTLALQTGELKNGERIFHLDCYFPGGEHRTYAFFKDKPAYDDIRTMVVEILEGKRKEISGFTPGKT